MSCIRRFRSFSLFRRAVAAVLIGAVVLLGVSACLTRGGGEATSSIGPVATAATAWRPSDGAASGVPLRRCAFTVLAALPDRRVEAAVAVARTPIVWSLSDTRVPEDWPGRVLERPPRAGALA